MTPRIYVNSSIASGANISLSESASRHLAQVLRLRPGDACILFNGDGRDYPAVIAQADRRALVVQVGEGVAAARESPLAVTLAQGLCSGDKMDYVVRKATELGVQRIVPVQGVASVVRLKGDRAESRVEHWRAIAVAACEQSGRSVLPEVEPVVPLAEWLPRAGPAAERWILSPRAGMKALRARPAPAGNVLLLVGPESGWTPAEEEVAVRAGFESVSIGPRILRTETAGLAMLAAMQALWGDF